MNQILTFSVSKKDNKTLVSSIKTDKVGKIVFGNNRIRNSGVWECELEEFPTHYKVMTAEIYVPLIEVTDEQNGVLILESNCGFNHIISLKHDSSKIIQSALYAYRNPKSTYLPFRMSFSEHELIERIEEFLLNRTKKAKKLIFEKTSFIQFR